MGESTITIEDGQLGSGFASADEYCLVAGCTSSGTSYAPAIYRNASSLITAYGYGPAVEYAAYHFQRTGKPIIFAKLPSTVAGANSAVDIDAVAGTSVITLTGTPRDSFQGIFTCTVGGTIGVTGIEFTYSLDGGKTTVGPVNLGTATTYLLPNSGITLAFAAGTLIAADVAKWRSTEPRWSGANLTTLFDTLLAGNLEFRAAMIVGECDAGSDATEVQTELERWEADHRYAFALLSGRFGPRGELNARPARMVGGPTLTFAEVGSTGDTITRSAGSWTADGFAIGDRITITGAIDPQNNLVNAAIVGLSATVITLGSDDLVAEVATADCAVTGYEPAATYITALRALFDSIGPVDTRIGMSAGMCRFKSAIAPGWRFRRPVAWRAMVRFFEFGIEDSLARVKSGALDVAILDDDGNPEEFDERAHGGAEAGRLIALRTRKAQRIYFASAHLLHSVGSDFTKAHYRAVMDVACDVTQEVLEQELDDDVEITSDGTIQEVDAVRIEGSVLRRLKEELTEPPKLRASSVGIAVSRDDDLSADPATLTATATVRPRGYLTNISTTISFGLET